MAVVTLTDFVAETLASISDGVRRAQDHSRSNNGVPIAPSSVDCQTLNAGDQLVKFNVTVEVVAGSEKKGSGQLGGPLLSIVTGSVGGEASSQSRNSSHQTIEFSIPMHFQLRWANATSSRNEV